MVLDVKQSKPLLNINSKSVIWSGIIIPKDKMFHKNDLDLRMDQ